MITVLVVIVVLVLLIREAILWSRLPDDKEEN